MPINQNTGKELKKKSTTKELLDAMGFKSALEEDSFSSLLDKSRQDLLAPFSAADYLGTTATDFTSEMFDKVHQDAMVSFGSASAMEALSAANSTGATVAAMSGMTDSFSDYLNQVRKDARNFFGTADLAGTAAAMSGNTGSFADFLGQTREDARSFLGAADSIRAATTALTGESSITGALSDYLDQAREDSRGFFGTAESAGTTAAGMSGITGLLAEYAYQAHEDAKGFLGAADIAGATAAVMSGIKGSLAEYAYQAHEDARGFLSAADLAGVGYEQALSELVKSANEHISKIDPELEDELTQGLEFFNLSDKAKKVVACFYYYYLLPFLISCLAGVAVINYYKAQNKFQSASTVAEVKSIARNPKGKFDRSLLKGYRVTIAQQLNFREGPNTKSKIIGELPLGTMVEIIDKTDRSWLFVEAELDGELERGWVSRRYTMFFR